MPASHIWHNNHQIQKEFSKKERVLVPISSGLSLALFFVKNHASGREIKMNFWFYVQFKGRSILQTAIWEMSISIKLGQKQSFVA